MRVLSLLSVCAFAAISSTDAYSKYAKLIPNGNGVKGVTAVGHTDPDAGGETNAFGKAFKAAGNTWTEALCKADADGDGQTNGEELGDPCCVWKSGGTPAVATGATDPGSATSKLDDAALTAARGLCKAAETPAAGTVKPNDAASNATPALTPGATTAAPAAPAAAGATPAAAPAAPAAAGSAAAATPAAGATPAAATTTGSDLYDWVELDKMNSTSAASSTTTSTTMAPSSTAAKSTNSSSANTTSAATASYTLTASSSGVAAVVAMVFSALALAL